MLYCALEDACVVKRARLSGNSVIFKGRKPTISVKENINSSHIPVALLAYHLIQHDVCSYNFGAMVAATTAMSLSPLYSHLDHPRKS